MARVKVSNAISEEGKAGIGSYKIEYANVYDGSKGDGFIPNTTNTGITPRIWVGPQNELTLKHAGKKGTYSGPPYIKRGR